MMPAYAIQSHLDSSFTIICRIKAATKALGILPLMVLLHSVQLSAQVTPFTSFYQQNWQMVNPAAIDRWQIFKYNTNSTKLFSVGFRGQWLVGNVEGRPLTYFASYENAPMVNDNSKNATGIKYGFTAFGDETGAFKNYGVSGNFSYYARISRKEVIHFGLSGSLYWQKIDEKQLRAANPDDALLSNLERSKICPDFSIGVFYRRRLPAERDCIYAGVSIPKVINRENNTLSLLDKGTPLYLVVGAFIGNGNNFHEGITFEPTVWVRHARGIEFYSWSTKRWQYLSVDASIRMYFDKSNFYIGGGGYGSFQSGMAEAGFLIEKASDERFRVGFSWNFPAFKSYLNLGHSLELTAAIGMK